MTIFWIFAAGLTGLAVLFAIVPLLSKRESAPEVSQDQLNLEVFRQQFQELDADLEAEKLDQTQYKAARRDLERELLYDIDGNRNTADGPKSGSRATITAVLLALALPAFAFGLYLTIGNSGIIPQLELAASGQATLPAGHPGMEGGQGMASLDKLVQRLAARLEANPEDPEGWLMLGRSYFAVNQPDKALEALERAQGLAPENPDIILAYAEAVAANSDGKLAGRPAELIAKAMEIDAGNTTGRWLDGLVVYQAGNFAGAVQRWESLLAELEPDAKDASELREFIADARQRAGMPAAEPIAGPEAQATTADPVPAEETDMEPAEATPPSVAFEVEATGTATSPTVGEAETVGTVQTPTAAGADTAGTAQAPASSEAQPTPPATPPTTETATTMPTPTTVDPGAASFATPPPAVTQAQAAGMAGTVTIKVSLAETLWKQANVNHALFVFAKAASGPPMPLAVKQLRAGDLPVTVTLDDSMSMMPALRLSSFPQIMVGARISASGQAVGRRGDLEGVAGPVRLGQPTPVDLVIDRIHP